jgi:protein-S-isoprenylcysteine O-methyltransferase Ste14
MTRTWFKPWGWIYRPTSWQAVVVTLLILAFCVQVFVAVDRRSHSASDTLYGVFPYIVPALLILDWIASRTSGARRHWDRMQQ